MRCPGCGATNPDGAAWCGQCYRRFDTPEPAEADAKAIGTNGHTGDAAAVLHAEQVTDPRPPTPATGTPATATTTATEGFRREGDEIQWQCPQCATYNDIALHSCAVCGTSFVERFRTEEAEPPRNWTAALALSVVAPGAGHVSVGRYGSGWARLLLFFAWVVGVVLLASSGGGSRALIVATPLILGALFLWAVTLVDVYRLQQGEKEILVGRTLLWLVVGVLLLLGMSLFAGVGGATGPPVSA